MADMVISHTFHDFPDMFAYYLSLKEMVVTQLSDREGNVAIIMP